MEPVEAATPTEGVLIDIWQAVLEFSPIATHDCFLDLGGDSLSAMMCISRVRRQLDYELMIEDFFLDSGTITFFADMIDSDKARNLTRATE